MFGPLLLMNMSQMQSFEPGDAEWGVKLEDVRGQVEAKEEVRRVVDIWQSGEQFERAGGKRERGLLLFGAPGTGKTMLAKAIATGFNSPFISMPGSGFAATFIGIDAIIVRLLARRAKKLARKWGGQCIVFIDEIDAVGMRRQSLGTGGQGFIPLTNGANVEDFLFYGPLGSRDPSGDLIVETRAWRDRLFEQRAPVSYGVPSGMYARLGQFYNFMFPGGMGGMGGGGLALNQLLVVMDGIDNPPWMRRTFTSKLNTMLDASFIVPRRLGNVRLRLPAARPRKDQIYFIGATNVPIDRLDPALIRPGRMGRHVWFRTPTKDDRLDILELYIGKVCARPRARPAEPARRDRADHERVLPGDDRAGDVDGVDHRAPHRPDGIRVGRSRRGRHDPRRRHGDRVRVRPARATRGCDSRGRPRGRGPCLHDQSRVDPSDDQEARRPGRRRPPLDDREGGASLLVPARDVPGYHLGPRRDGGRARRLRRELERGRRRRRRRHRPLGDDGRPGGDGTAALRA